MKQMFRLGGGVSQTKRYIIPVIFVILLLIITVGLSYAMYTFTGSGTKENVIQTGHIVITFNDVNNISIQNRYPETDSEGLASTDTNSQMTFTVTSDITGDTKVNYALGITDIQEGATLTQDYIKIYLKKGNSVVAGFTENKGELISSFKPLYIENVMTSHVLLTDVISGSEVHTYTLKAWIDENYKLLTQNTSGKYEVIDVDKCASYLKEILGEHPDGDIGMINYCSGIGEPSFIDALNEGEDYLIEKGIIPYMLENNIIKIKENVTGVEHSNTTKEETFAFKIKGYGTTESIEVINPKPLNQLILGTNNSNVLSATATLTDTYSNAGDASGLYKSVDGETNSGTTYFYRGAVTNNYVSFAGLMWRIVRINENGSIRLLLNDGINNNTEYKFNPSYKNYSYMYYSNSNVYNGIKRTVDTWYDNNIKGYENYIADTEFCEQFKVSNNGYFSTAGSVTVPLYSSYTPNFKCSTDKNGKGILTLKVGLLTYDEAVHAGNYRGKSSASYITSNNYWYWLMSPTGASSSSADAWRVDHDGGIINNPVNGPFVVRPVISLKAGMLVTGSGTSDDPYLIQKR